MTDTPTEAGPELDAEIQTEVFGWKWMSWIGTPVKGTPGYPKHCRVKQFFAPETMARQSWQELFRTHKGGEATGDEPLSYAYCSSGGYIDARPRFSRDWAAAGEVLGWVRRQPKEVQQGFYDGLAAQWRQWCSEQETEGMTDDEWCDIHLMTGTSRWFILHADVPLAICLAALEAIRKGNGDDRDT